MTTLIHTPKSPSSHVRRSATASRASRANRSDGPATLLDRVSTRLAAVETPLGFVALWTVWAPLYAGALLSELMSGPATSRDVPLGPHGSARPFFSARFREIAPGLVDARRADLGRVHRTSGASS